MRIGILGAGQLSRMLALSGIPLGLDFVFYAEAYQTSTRYLGTTIIGDLGNHTTLKNFATQVDVITYENENIPVATLDFLSQFKSPIHPNLTALKISQDRLFEKTLFHELGLFTTDFINIAEPDDLLHAIQSGILHFPFFIKKRKLGYDGKGQIKINNQTELAALIDTIKNKTSAYMQDAIAEKLVQFDREVSLIAVSTPEHTQFYDLSENKHENGILITTQNKPHDPFFEQAKNHTLKIINQLSYIGVLAVEFFQVGDKLLVNEIAPRVHNTGHWTIEGAVTSQFENHIRAICGFPLGETTSTGLATMHNILGTMPDKHELLQTPGLHLHDYQKEEKPGRKIGHTTLISPF